MHPLLSPKNLVIAALGAAVIGLGTVVAVDHTATAAPRAQTASLSASTIASSRLSAGNFAGVGQLQNEASRVFGFVTTDTKLTWQQIGADVLRGETLGQIAGANTAKVERDALAEVKAGLDLGVVKKVITSAEETRLMSDARDAIAVLMDAKVSLLLPSAR